MSIPVDFIIQARDQTRTAFNNISERLDRLQNKYSAFGKISKGMLAGGAIGVAAVAGITAVTGALLAQTMQINDTLGNLQDLSDKYKISTDSLQLYGLVAGDAGVEIETVAKGLGKLQENLAKARNGGKEVDLFASVGVKGKDINKSAEEVFDQVSDIFAKKNKSSDDVQKILAAKALFGKAGIELMPLLETGGAQLHEIMLQMRKDGLILSAGQIKAADDTGDAFGKAQKRLEAVKNRAFLELNPAIDAITKSINDMLNSGGSGKLQASFKQIGDQIAKIAPKAIEKIPMFFEWLSNIDYGGIIDSIKSIGGAIGTVFSAINKVGTLVGWDKLIFGGVALFLAPAALALAAIVPTIYAVGTALFFAFAANPALLAITVLATAALLIYRNWGSVAAWFSDLWDSVKASFASGVDYIMPALSAISGAWDGLVAGFSSALGFLIPILSTIGAAIFDHLTAPIRLVISAVNLLIAGFNKISSVKIPQIQQIPTGAQLMQPSAQGPATQATIPVGAKMPAQTNQRQVLDINVKTQQGTTAVATPQQGTVVRKVNTGKMA
ncbi:MAG TPA: hypothetical protein VIH30_03545 [Aquirhabdus sp.]